MISRNPHFLGACYLPDALAVNQCVLSSLCLQNIHSVVEFFHLPALPLFLILPCRHFGISLIIVRHLLIVSHILGFVPEVKGVKTNKIFPVWWRADF